MVVTEISTEAVAVMMAPIEEADAEVGVTIAFVHNDGGRGDDDGRGAGGGGGEGQRAGGEGRGDEDFGSEHDELLFSEFLFPLLWRPFGSLSDSIAM